MFNIGSYNSLVSYISGSSYNIVQPTVDSSYKIVHTSSLIDITESKHDYNISKEQKGQKMAVDSYGMSKKRKTSEQVS